MIDNSICFSAFTGSPWTSAAKVTPQSTAGNQDPIAIATSAQARHFGSSILPRHSMAQMRTIIATRMANSGRYSPENNVAYISGNAANIAPPAVISHTSLPSHTGPMVLSTARSCCSRWPAGARRPKNFISIPTPKSKPSKTRKPTKSAARAMNQKSCNPMSVLPQ